MADPFMGEIRIWPANFAPRNWAFCNGQLLSIAQNSALFSLVGTTYGGDGQTTFALPNLQSRVPIHAGTGPDGSNYTPGQQDGVESVTLTAQQIPAHTHTLVATTGDAIASPNNALLATAQSSQAGVRVYSNQAPNVQMNPASMAVAGGNVPHDNIQPYLSLNYIICLSGIYPSRA